MSRVMIRFSHTVETRGRTMVFGPCDGFSADDLAIYHLPALDPAHTTHRQPPALIASREPGSSGWKLHSLATSRDTYQLVEFRIAPESDDPPTWSFGKSRRWPAKENTR
jgi:hypothetical protein